MKVQIDVDQELWKRTRIAALERGETLGVFVGHALEWACVNQSKSKPESTTVESHSKLDKDIPQ